MLRCPSCGSSAIQFHQGDYPVTITYCVEGKVCGQCSEQRSQCGKCHKAHVVLKDAEWQSCPDCKERVFPPRMASMIQAQRRRLEKQRGQETTIPRKEDASSVSQNATPPS